jgi:hypothetical protein
MLALRVAAVIDRAAFLRLELGSGNRLLASRC